MRIIALLLLVTLTACASTPPKPSQSFESWLADFKSEAAAKGISQPVITEAFEAVDGPNDEVVKLDRTQPEKTRSFTDYAASIVSEQRIEEGKAQWQSHKEILTRIESAYGVPAPVLLALWGIESRYGQHQGNFSIVESLTSLAYDGRRATFFRQQLLDALTILQQEHKTSEELTGSWAGAMGQVQFMPSSFLQFAVDFDGDGKKDIWNSDADALASMANYLHQRGWHYGESWGIEVQLPPGTDWTTEKDTLPLEQWQTMGIRLTNGADLPQTATMAHLVIPDDASASAFLAFSNYNVIMDWNRSTYFASAVGLLANAIAEP